MDSSLLRNNMAGFALTCIGTSQGRKEGKQTATSFSMEDPGMLLT